MKEQILLKVGKYKISLNTVIFLLGIAGILLIGLSSILPEGKKEETGVRRQGEEALLTDAEAYAAQLEERLRDILEQTEGVGTARVMVTLENGYQKIYAKTEKVGSDLSEDIRARDEKKTQEKKTTEQAYVLVDGAGGKVPLVTAQLEPEVKGVVVVCQGGSDPLVVRRVVDTVRVALDISSSRISVCRLAQGAGQ